MSYVLTVRAAVENVIPTVLVQRMIFSAPSKV